MCEGEGVKYKISVSHVLIEGVLTVNTSNNSRKDIANELIDNFFFVIKK